MRSVHVNTYVSGEDFDQISVNSAWDDVVINIDKTDDRISNHHHTRTTRIRLKKKEAKRLMREIKLALKTMDKDDED